MRNRIRMAVAFAALAMLAVGSFTSVALAQSKDAGKIVIVFKDGHQQSLALAEIARIDFRDAAGVAAASPSRARFMGRWKVGTGTGGTFIITLKPEGKAEKTLGRPQGFWLVEHDEARVIWEDGWKDVIRKVGGKFQKFAFSPGTSFDDKPNNTAEAEYTEPL